MTAQQDNPFLTITLTDRQPVKIKKEDWPILAEASDDWYDSEHHFQANRESHWKIIVRQHNDKREIVYATYRYNTRRRNGADAAVRGGEMLPSDASIQDTVAAIHRVAAWMRENIDGEDAAVFTRLANECIADLPAEEIA